MSRLADFYADSRLCAIFLTLLTCVCWSYFDLLNGLVRHISGSIIFLSIGVALAAAGALGVFLMRQPIVSCLCCCSFQSAASV